MHINSYLALIIIANQLKHLMHGRVIPHQVASDAFEDAAFPLFRVHRFYRHIVKLRYGGLTLIVELLLDAFEGQVELLVVEHVGGVAALHGVDGGDDGLFLLGKGNAVFAE